MVGIQSAGFVVRHVFQWMNDYCDDSEARVCLLQEVCDAD